jgi:uncharacterized protein (TIGR02145 family)
MNDSLLALGRSLPLTAFFLVGSSAIAGCSGSHAEVGDPSALEERDAAPPTAADAGPNATPDGDAASEAVVDPGATTTFVDPRDGQSYALFRRGTQAWFARNLNYAIPGKSFCYDDDPQSCDEDGRLYLWSVARTACPAGTHLPTDAEWKTFETALGMSADDLDLEGYDTARGTDEGTQLKAADGFAAKMAGYRSGNFYDARGDRTYIWTATTRGSEVWRRRIANAESTIFRFTNPPSTFAISIRCVLDG